MQFSDCPVFSQYNAVKGSYFIIFAGTALTAIPNFEAHVPRPPDQSVA